MGERQAFGTNLRRKRIQHGVSLEQIAASTKVTADLWEGLERSDLSRWPTGIYARGYVRAYAVEIGVDPDATVDEFCRLFPNGDRRAERVVRGQAAIVGHDLQWQDDLVGSVIDEKRASTARPPATPMAFTRTGRIVASLLDLGGALATSAAIRVALPLGWTGALAAGALTYHAVSLMALGSTPAVWAIDTYLSSRHPTATRTKQPRFLKLVRGSDRVKA
ncbi:MAG TPA: helix-turn-helix transcriptional regulator [Vicinamibacterales bacterium]|jgi:transcriptional regulator with XRE-family HTH domain|nr:helix-turn-helix transcriptional regulator [Vicinamibacterales bacterium]